MIFLWVSLWHLKFRIFNIWLHSWMHLQNYEPFHFDLSCVCVRQTLTTTQRGYCFLCLNFIQMSATGCHGLLWRIPFALAQTNTQIQSFWGITELFTHWDFCSAQCTKVCIAQMFILGYWPWLKSDPQESVLYGNFAWGWWMFTVCLTRTLKWHQLIYPFGTEIHAFISRFYIPEYCIFFHLATVYFWSKQRLARFAYFRTEASAACVVIQLNVWLFCRWVEDLIIVLGEKWRSPLFCSLWSAGRGWLCVYA